MVRPARVRLVLIAAVLLTGAGAATYFYWPPRVDTPGPTEDADAPPPDPRLAIDTPFRNVRPDVVYTGDAVCAGCHAKLCDSYHQHAMGRSAILPTEPADGVEKFGPHGQPSFTAFGHEYRVERKGDTWVHTETVRGPDGQPPVVTAAAVVAGIGSGTRGRSYLTARDGSLWQTGVSWFSEKQIWDASPGFAPGQHAQRPVPPKCLFCHVDRVTPVPGTLNRYREPLIGTQVRIGCERCHGPGALHVAERQADTEVRGIDMSIVNPKHLSADLREDVCRQCHLQGEQRVVRRGRAEFDYRPGLPLDQFLTVFVRHPDLTDYHRSVGQVEQMAVSKCFLGSGGKFGCTSCHDPHASPAAADKEGFYRERCLRCHQDKGCSLPPADRRAKNDACTACHMPRAASANIAHTAVTDHRVLRVPQPAKPGKGTLPPGAVRLAAAPGSVRGPGDPEWERDLGLALSILSDTRSPGGGDGEAVRRLTDATARHPSDVDAWEALAYVRVGRSEWVDALEAAERAVALDPGRERALGLAAVAAARLRRLDVAEGYTRRAIEVNPGNPAGYLQLVDILLTAERFAEAEAEVRALLGRIPNQVMARTFLAVALHQQGKAAAARAEMELAARIDPRQAAALWSTFRARTE